MTDTLTHIHNLQAAAIDLEDRMRKSGLYASDCESFDALVRRGNRRGVALLFDEDGNLDEVVSLNDGGKHVEVSSEGNKVHIEHNFPERNNAGPRSKKHRDEADKMVGEAGESYESMGGSNFQKAAARSHEREKETKGRFEPQTHTTGDAARRARELKVTQDKNTAIAKRQYQEGISRTEKVAAAMKAASDKQWGNGRIA